MDKTPESPKSVVVDVPEKTMTVDEIPTSLEYWTVFVRYPKGSGLWVSTPICVPDKNEAIRQIQSNGSSMMDSDIVLAAIKLPILSK